MVEEVLGVECGEKIGGVWDVGRIMEREWNVEMRENGVFFLLMKVERDVLRNRRGGV